MRAGAEILSDGTARYAQREFNPLAAGGPIKPMDCTNATISEEGIAAVRQHVARFGYDKANAAMIDRLERIARAEIAATDYDRRFYTHEMRELERYRNLGIPDGLEGSYEIWNNAHTATLADFGITDLDLERNSLLYHPDTWPLLGL